MDTAARSQAALQAAIHGNLRLLKKLAKQVDLRGAKDAGGRSALHAAAGKGYPDICRFLVEEAGLDVNSRCGKGETAVLIAASEGHLPVLRYLLDHGGDPAMPDARGLTPLHNSAKNGFHLIISWGHCEAVRLLLSKGVPVEPLANDWTPLHFAVSRDQDQALSILLDHGADPNRINHNLCSPLMMACALRSLKCIKLLVQAGADVNLRTPYGQTALSDTITLCLPDMHRFQHQVAADPNNPGKVLDDSLANIIKFLLEAGADPNIPNEHGKIPIMTAAAWGQRALVEILFSWTKPIPSLPDWNVDAIMRTLKMKTKQAVSVWLKEHIGNWKSKGKKAFANEDYLAGTYFYSQAIGIDQHDATLFANRSLCYLRMGEGQMALNDAEQCRMMRPRWAKAWYRKGAALSLLKNYEAAVHAFVEALKLDATSDEIKIALREAMEAMRSSGEKGR
ncbi:hypothetical protein ACP70R_012090 [Stipagrostis hirtigluma subsp. patula]